MLPFFPTMDEQRCGSCEEGSYDRGMGRITIDFERCKACYFCIETCPKKLIEKSNEVNSRGYHPAVPKDGKDCTGCRLCAEVCPDVAIEVYR
jgi:2-oxoglutarate ferredoxin oxidoreductase subunit delta